VDTITIPRRISRRGDLIVIPRVEYEEVLKIKKRLLREEKDTDEAIRVFHKEMKSGKLKKAARFSEILRAHLPQRI
jgi:hypothetical protein